MIVCNIIIIQVRLHVFLCFLLSVFFSITVSVSCGVSLIQYHDYIAAIFIY